MADHGVYTMGDLSRRSLGDSTVRSVLTAWQNGRYPTLETALVALAVRLCDEKASRDKRLVKLLRSRGPA